MNNTFTRKKPLLKKFLIGLKNNSGRNNSGKITMRHKGGGCKQNYRKIDFYRNTEISGIVTSIEYDPNRTSYIASIYDKNKKSYTYIIAPLGLCVGDIVNFGRSAENKLGHSVSLLKIPVGSIIHNISIVPNTMGTISRSAGTFSQVLKKTTNEAVLRLSSGEKKKLPIQCIASFGIVSNEYHFANILNKAGKSRWLNIRPTVRGVAMNPIDHPHGGGEGKTSGKSKTPWGSCN